MNAGPKPKSEQSLKDGFYVEQTCCMSCGVPQSIAPDLVGWEDENRSLQCYWIRQPETSEEVDRAIEILHTQELDCHRYGGSDPVILKTAPAQVCDHLHPETAFRSAPIFGPTDLVLKLELSESTEGFWARLWRSLRK